MVYDKCGPFNQHPIFSSLPPRVEKIDNLTPITNAIDYLSKLLLEDQESNHLDGDTVDAINQSIAELSRALVKATAFPSILVKEND
jgi:hypothetical protein